MQPRTLGRGVKTQRLFTEISSEEGRRVKAELWRAAQLAVYPDLYAHLKKDKQYVTPKGHPLQRVCPIMGDHGVLQVIGRLLASIYPAEERQPVMQTAVGLVTCPVAKVVRVCLRVADGVSQRGGGCWV